MKQKTPNIVPVLVLSLITTVTWIFFSVYTAITAKPAPAVPDKVSQSLDPTLDQKTVENIKAKLFLDESQISTASFSALFSKPSPTPSPEPKPEATKIASPSGTLVK